MSRVAASGGRSDPRARADRVPARAWRAAAALVALALAWTASPAAAESLPAETVFANVVWSGASEGDTVAAGRVVGVDAFGSIQAAVDAAPAGGTVNVAAGTYIEQVIIGKNLTLAGAGADSTIIVSPGLLPAAFSAGGFTNRAILLARDAADVHVRDLMVDGQGQGDLNERFIGIGYFNAGGSVSLARVTGVRNAPLNNVQHGFGVYCQNSTGGPYALEIDRVEVDDFQKAGMLLNGTGMVVDVHDCTITGSGDLGEIAQNGIQLGTGAGGSIRDSRLSNLRFVQAVAVSGAVLVYQPGSPVTLSGFTGANAFSNVQSPIRWYDGSGTVDGVEVTGPIIEGQDFGPISISNFSGPPGAFSATGSADPPALPPAEPVVEAVAGTADGLRVLQTTAVQSVDLRNLCLTGTDVPATVGVYLFTTGGTLNVTVSNAVLHDWDYGIRTVGAAVTASVTNSSIAGNVTAGFDNGGGSAQSAVSNWWGDPGGPSGDGPGAGDAIIGGNVAFTPWLLDGTNTATGCGFAPAPERIEVTTDALCISLDTPCVTFDIQIARTTTGDVRAFSIPVQLSPNLQLCAGTSSIAEGTYLSGAGETFFAVVDHGGGAYTVDGTILGSPCGATAPAGTLFTLQVAKAPGPDGVGTVSIGAPVLRDCANGPVAAAAGPPRSITIETSGLPGCGASGLPEQIAVSTADSCISTQAPCASFEVTIARTTSAAVRAFSVPVQLSPNLQLCSGVASITEGSYLSDAGATFFTVTDRGGGAYTVDGAILGLPCGATAITGTLFRIEVAKGGAADSLGTVTIGAPILRDCANGDVSVDADTSATIPMDTTGPAAIADVSAVQQRSGNDADGTTQVAVSFTSPGDAVSVEVYRAGFGGYPEYDDAPGAGVPAPPAYPPAPPWTLTALTASGQNDEVAQRDFWYYVVFTRDSCGNVSGVSNRSAGVLNYHLGDVSDGLTAGQGNNAVHAEDVSLLGAHYPAWLTPADPLGYLDVGPTADLSVNGLPTTDHRLDFEDLILFALNYSVVSAPLGVAADPAARNALTLEVPALPATGGTFEAVLRFEGRGDVQGMSAALAWDPSVVEPLGAARGDLLDAQGREPLFLPAGPGAFDLALPGRGAGIAGSGVLARVAFRVLGVGDPGIALERLVARDRDNAPVALDGADGPPPAPLLPARTAFGAVSPNPSRGGPRIEFSLATAGRVGLAVFDLAGRRVRTLLDEPRQPGLYRLAWDGRDEAGTIAPPGFYVLRLDAPGATARRTVIIVR